MKTYTISAQDLGGKFPRIPLKRIRCPKDDIMQQAWAFSQRANLCYVVVTLGSKHVATYHNGEICT